MSTKAYKNIGDRQKVKNATQSTKLEGQIKNSDGAYVYKVDDWQKLDRFLILGTEGGSYYASERKLTKDNAKNVLKLIKADGQRVVDRVVEISLEGRAPKNDPALFVLAMASAEGDVNTRRAAYAALPKVARIGTHLFHFAEFREQFAGWGKGMRKAVEKWYNEKNNEGIAFQLGKYQSRDGWSHRDLLRLAHVNPGDDAARSTIYKWAIDSASVEKDALRGASPVLDAFEEIKKTDNEKRVLELVTEFKLPLEMIPTDKRSRKVYEVMLDNFGITALIRNLGKLSQLGILDSQNFTEVNKVIDRLLDKEAINKGRVHPIAILLALSTYKAGRGMKGSLTWNVNRKIVDALDEAFYLAFKNIDPTGKRIMIALDVSASMTWESSRVAGTFLTAREASAAMSMAVARTERNYLVTTFSGGGFGYSRNNNDDVAGISELAVTGKDKLEDVLRKVNNLPANSTDCSLPMRWALKKKAEFDAFIVYTDNETNAYGQLQPSTALKRYRDQMGIDSKLIVNGMVANDFTIADPNDPGMLDVVGFDSSAPEVMSRFIKGEV